MDDRVKICGIRRIEDALLAVELGAERARLHLLAGEPALHRSGSRARRSSRRCRRSSTAVGVFVDQPLGLRRGCGALLGLGAVQLHGDEPPTSTYARGRIA